MSAAWPTPSGPGAAEPSEAVSRRAEELFGEHRDSIHRRVDRLFAGLMVGQWLFAIVVAALFSPYAWAGKVLMVHVHVYAAVLLGGTISSLPVALALLRPGWTGKQFTGLVALPDDLQLREGFQIELTAAGRGQ